ncbi:MAG: hypothetical protein IPM48_09040 [Saprospiraceae bacterium]|nr:hypothetical protein [Saprospiraceae bacterium]
MNQFSFQYPSYYIAFAFILAIAAAGILYYRSRQLSDKSLGHKLLLSSLRGLSIFLLLLLLLNPIIRYYKKEIKKPELILALDESASMKSKDSSWISGYQIAEEDMIRQLAEKYDIKTYSFGQRVFSDARFDFREPASDIEGLLDKISEEADFQQLKGMILVSDGIYYQGRNPLYHPLTKSIPVHTIFVGDSTQDKDLRIQRVFHNDIIFSGDRFAVETDLQAWLCNGEKTNFRISKFENGNWNSQHEESVEIDKPGFFVSKTVVLPTDKPGLFRYRIHCSTLNGEKNIQNNVRDFYIEVLDARKKVLILANAPHPDISALRSALDELKNYALEIKYIYEQPVISEQTQLVIFHNLPNTNADISPILGKMDAWKIPRVYIMGNQTDLNMLSKHQDILQISGHNASSNESQAIVNDLFNLFNLSEESKQMIQRFPPLISPFGQYQLNQSAAVLLYQKIGKVETQFPLWSFSDRNGIKTLLICAEGLWKWKLNNFIFENNFNAFYELISKSMQYTATKEDRRKFRAMLSKKVFSESDPLIFNAELYNDAYELINQPDVQLKIKSSDQKEYDFTFSKKDKYYELHAGSLPEGDYSFFASTEWNGQRLNSEGRFSIQAGNPELDNLVARPDLLRNLAILSGGKSSVPSTMDQLQQYLQSDEMAKPVIYSSLEVKPFIDWKWLFVLIFVCLAAEWFLRRYWGSY